jgi:hypothetical protein
MAKIGDSPSERAARGTVPVFADCRRAQGGRIARPVPDQACVRLSAATASAATLFAFAGSVRPGPAATLVVTGPAVEPAIVPAGARTSPVTRRYSPVFVPGRATFVPVMMGVPEPAQQRTPEPRARGAPRRSRRSCIGRTREQQQQGCYGDETSLHDCSFDGDHSLVSTAVRRILFRAVRRSYAGSTTAEVEYSGTICKVPVSPTPMRSGRSRANIFFCSARSGQTG